MTESDGVTRPMLPNEARLRNLTYSAPLYVDIAKKTIALRQGMGGQTEEASNEEQYAKMFIGKVSCDDVTFFYVIMMTVTYTWVFAGADYAAVHVLHAGRM